MKMIKITKMQGCGNDFVIVDKTEFDKTNLSMSDFAKKVCDRNFGIGADGLIIPDTNCETADIGWFFYNSDGTTAQMCGNGMRCFAKYVVMNKLVDKKEFTVQTLAGIMTPKVLENGDVQVNMSKPILEPQKIPFWGNNNLNFKLAVKDREFIANAVSMGNPHCIIFTNENIRDLAKTYGPQIESHELFPEKTNVEFIKIKSRNEIDLYVYERGCGITLACGTGACASVVAAILNNLTDNTVRVNLPGGVVTVDWQGSAENTKQNVMLIGPAEFTFFADFIL